jgi:CHAT domain-containing protein/Tfp pilus assembly protein PilF
MVTPPLQRQALPYFTAFLLLAAFSLPVAAQEARWKELNAQVEELTKQGKYAEAVSAAQEFVRVSESTFGPDSPNLATSLYDLAVLYTQQGQFAEAETLHKRALTIRQKSLEPDNAELAKSLSGLGELYLTQGRSAEAEPLLTRAVPALEKALGPDAPDLADAINNLASVYDQEGRYGDAEPLYKRALAIHENALGPDAPAVAMDLNNFGGLRWEQGQYLEAESLYKRALEIQEKAMGPDAPEVSIDLNNLASLYDDQGRYLEAEPLSVRAVAIEEKALGPEHPNLATALATLASIYTHQARYSEAELLYNRALKIHEKALGESAPDVALDLNNLAGIYDDLGRYADAEPLYKRTLAIQEKALGPEHADLATSLNNLAEVYRKQSRFAEAEPLYQRALAIYRKALGPDHPKVAGSLNNLAFLYQHEGRTSEAETLYKQALAIREKALGPAHPSVADTLGNLADLYVQQDRYDDAQPLLEHALAIYEKALPPEHPSVATSLNNLATLYYNKRSPQQAAPYYDRSLTALTHQFDYYFSFMSEKDRLAFLNTVSNRFPRYFNFCLNYRQQLPDLPGKMYDVVLWEKGFIAQSVAAVRSQIEASGDKESLALLDQLTAKKTQLARLLTAQPADREQWLKQVDQLTRQANDLEGQLVRHSSALAEQKKLAHVSWRDVQKSLKPGDAAVELVRFPYYDGKKLTGANYYVALIVTPESSQPALLVLVDTNTPQPLEQDALRKYRQSVNLQQSAPANTPSFYDVFWKPLEPAFAGAKRIYLSPDGVLNQVSLAVVPDAARKLLIERYDLRIVNSTKDILREKRASNRSIAVLIGNPTFGLQESAQRESLLSLQKNVSTNVHSSSDAPARTGMTRGPLSRDRFGSALDPLPATQLEVKEIDSLLEKQNWQVQLYTGQEALKESIKRVQHPRVLHVATHGFFQPDTQRNVGDRPNEDRPAILQDPMLRSGLFFAGANRAITGQPTPDDLDDGILTAYEATGLNLQGTELVVLSACDTARGEQQTGEGVFGLRRAFQEAGAQSILMSMWSVPDQETQELMTLFYSKWLAGKDKHDALREAQLQLRETVKTRYGKDSPFYWGAFVLVGQ